MKHDVFAANSFEEVLKGKAKIPKVIHQIWIGPRVTWVLRIKVLDFCGFNFFSANFEEFLQQFLSVSASEEPPCLWIDTFRVEYLAEHPSWGFHLWSDEEVAKLPMINEEIYTKARRDFSEAILCRTAIHTLPIGFTAFLTAFLTAF